MTFGTISATANSSPQRLFHMISSSPTPTDSTYSGDSSVSDFAQIVETEKEIKKIIQDIITNQKESHKASVEMTSLRRANKILITARKIAPYIGLLSGAMFFGGLMTALNFSGGIGLTLLGIGLPLMGLSYAGREYIPRINNGVVCQFYLKSNELESLISQKKSLVKNKVTLEKELTELRKSAREITDMKNNLNPENTSSIVEEDDYVNIRGIRLEKVKPLSER
jgi:hypothetical protein